MRVLHNYGITCLDSRWRLIQVGRCLRRSHAIWRWRVEISFSYIKTKRKDIITFCDKTITDLKGEVKNIKQNPKTILENKKFLEVQNTINSNQKIKRLLLKTMHVEKVQSSKVWTKANSVVFAKRRRIHQRRSNYRKRTNFACSGCEER